ncbi:MAG: uracil-DNA glycosylase family protein [Acidimicrobiia bacterium]
MDRGTLDVYEQRARDWQRLRPPRRREDARAFAARVPGAGVRADLGCGPGSHTPDLGLPVVAVDAAFAMLELARREVPHAWPVRADLEALPFRDRSLAGAWARASYLHVPRARLPMALAHLHRALEVGAPFDGTVKVGDHDGPMPDDEFPGRVFSRWEPHAFADVLGGAGFDVEATDVDVEWIRFRCRRARTLPDTVGPGLRVLVCGLNPSLYAADVGIGFARPGNRFWPAALDAGLVTKDRDPFHAYVHDRVGMTDLVKRAAAAASELTAGEYRAGAARVERLVRWHEPGAVVFVGLAGWRAAVDRRAVAGWQPGGFGGRPAYVMPSTSGLNARTPPSALAAHLRTVRDAVGPATRA